MSQSDRHDAALQASVGQAAAGTAERVIRELLQPVLDAAEAARMSAQAASEARLQEAVSAIHESARRSTRETLDAARPALEQATRDMVDAALADAARNAPPAPAQALPAAPPPDSDPVLPPPAGLSRAVLPWLAGLSLAVLYVLVRSFL